jgi:hypothetical protein
MYLSVHIWYLIYTENNTNVVSEKELQFVSIYTIMFYNSIF